jgi:hypothetical protein
MLFCKSAGSGIGDGCDIIASVINTGTTDGTVLTF